MVELDRQVYLDETRERKSDQKQQGMHHLIFLIACYT